MNQWFYSHKGEQKGPVSGTELARLAEAGKFFPQQDLVWKEGMADWKKMAEVPELKSPAKVTGGPDETIAPVAGGKVSVSNDPYQPPATSHFSNPTPEGYDPPEIAPGSSPLGITACISRAFDLTKRYFGIVFAVWLIYFAINMGVGVVQEIIEGIAGVPTSEFRDILGGDATAANTPATVIVQLLTNLAAQVVTIFLTLGMTRFALNLMAGKPAEVGMIFGEGSKLWRGFVVSILYGLVVGLGTLFLIVPGIHLALKYSQAQTAVVDKDLGIMESFQYSAEITQNSMWHLLGLAILTLLINIGGFIAICVGLIFTIPLTWLAWLLAYRWLKHGPAALEDRGLLRQGYRL